MKIERDTQTHEERETDRQTHEERDRQTEYRHLKRERERTEMNMNYGGYSREQNKGQGRHIDIFLYFH